MINFKSKVHPLFNSLFPYTFILLLGYSLRRTHGFIKTNHLIYISLGLLFFIIHHFRNKQLKLSSVYLSVIYVVFSALLTISPDLFYPKVESITYFIRVISFLNIINALSFFFKKSRVAELFNKISPIIFSSNLLCYLLVITASPNPLIDVYTVTQEGADFLLNGINPYSSQYSDIFNGRYGYVAGYVYWPGILLTLSPFKWVLSDVRYFYVVSYILTLIAFNKLMLGEKIKQETRKIFLLLWMSFPVVYFVLEQTWTENLIIAQLSTLLLLLQRRRFYFAAIVLGFLCATKQYNLFLAILTCAYAFTHLRIKTFFTFLLICALSAIIIFTPFLIWNHHDFIQVTLVDLLRYEPRADSLSWASWLFHHYQIRIPSLISMSIYLLPTLIGSYFIVLKKKNDLRELIFWLITTYFCVFLFGKQAFCNYYYLISFLLITYTSLSLRVKDN
ncbi:hypothetical protein [Halobacteriovorax sp. HLS]|uniref:hypothetical protein n=1 Tax=Halobacteriovorax sp. HLS TaxID=2234000 RepID=UPI000FD72755|nr:hypothetical protein [Halobacteriovorax sp. HLS]